MKIKDYDFLDFGASKGGSIDFAMRRLGGTRGLGIDINPERVAKMQKAGYEAMVGDFCDLTLPKKSVRFVLMSHILEHLPDLSVVERTIDMARRVAKDYLVITGPFFDEDKYLAKHGFKFHWSDYTGHTCHLTTNQLRHILADLGLNDYELYFRRPIESSDHEHLVPLRTKRDEHQYNPAKHPPKKKTMTFDRPIWTDFVCYVRLRPVVNWRELTRGFKGGVPYIKQVGETTYRWKDVDGKYQRAKAAIAKAQKKGERPSRELIRQRNKYHEIIRAWQTDDDTIHGEWYYYARRAGGILKRMFAMPSSET